MSTIPSGVEHIVAAGDIDGPMVVNAGRWRGPTQQQYVKCSCGWASVDVTRALSDLKVQRHLTAAAKASA